MWYEFEFVGMENSHSGLVRTDLRVRRKSKTLLSLQGRIEFTDDFNDTYDVSGQLTKYFGYFSYSINCTPKQRVLRMR